MTRRGWSPAWIVAALCAWSCNAITDADSFAVGSQATSERLCEICPQDLSLRHAPCPPNTGDPGEHVAFFAVRHLDFGGDAATWVDGYHAGMDQDCSTRPEGRAVMCAERTNQTTDALPHGVDNALAQKVLHGLGGDAGFTLTEQLNEALTRGEGGMLLILDGWNRTPNDPQVGARLIATRGTLNGEAPRWDGTDLWEAYATRWDPRLPQVPSTLYNVSTTAYVRDGQLVWDVRGEETLRLYVQSRGAVLRLDLRDGVVMGRVVSSAGGTQIEDASFAGVWNLFDAERQAGAMAQISGGCDPSTWCPLEAALRSRLGEAPDMQLPGSDKGPTETCDAISVGIAAEFEETGGVATFAQAYELPASCGGDTTGCPEL